MELNEYYVKEIFRLSGIPVLDGHVAYTPIEARNIAQQLGGDSFWIKPQLMSNQKSYTYEELQNKFFAASPLEVEQKATLIMGESLSEPNAVFSSTIQRLYIEQATLLDVFCRLVFRVDFEKMGITFSITQDDQEILSLLVKNMQLDKVFFQTVLRTLGINKSVIKKEFMNILNKSFQLFLDYGAMAIELSPVVYKNNTFGLES